MECSFMKAIGELLKFVVSEYKFIFDLNRHKNEVSGSMISNNDSSQLSCTTDIPFLSYHLTDLIIELLKTSFLKTKIFLEKLFKFYFLENLNEIQNLGKSSLQGVEKLCLIYTTDPNDKSVENQISEEFDITQINLLFYEKKLSDAGCYTLSTSCLFYNFLSKVIKSRNSLFNQANYTATLFLNVGLNRSPLSVFATPDKENLIRYIFGSIPTPQIFSKNDKDKVTIKNEPHMRVFTEFLTKINDKQLAYNEIHTAFDDFT